jgi:hypothetical protein
MSAHRDRKLEDALAGWDPAAHLGPLDPLSISKLRRAALAELERDAGRTTVAWLRLAVGAAATLTLAFALWSTRAPEAVRPRQASGSESTTPATPSLPTEPVPPVRSVASPPVTAETARAPAEDRVAAATQPDPGEPEPVRQSRLDFRTAGGTRVVWIMRSDFEPSSGPAESS